MAWLQLTVQFHDSRYHGAGAWPPSPARLFQALAAAAAQGASIPGGDSCALEWLESLDAPQITAPPASAGQKFTAFVPDNDMDLVLRGTKEAGEIREAKRVQPWLFGEGARVVYRWVLAEGVEDRRQAEAVCSLSGRVFQLGRGVDMAWASGAVIEAADLCVQGGGGDTRIYRPGEGSGGQLLDCPQPGSLQSLRERYAAGRQRFAVVGGGVVLRNPPRPRFRAVRYDCPPAQFVFELRNPVGERGFVPQALTTATDLVVEIRDGAASKLRAAMPEKAAMVERVFMGSRDAGEAEKGQRLRILPLPSIGHAESDLAVRRVLVEVPPTQSLLAPEDVHWAFSGLDRIDEHSGAIIWSLVAAESDDFAAAHYGSGEGARVWRTLTPVALPFVPPQQGGTGAERVARDAKLAAAVAQGLRHAGIEARAESIVVQREPFDVHGREAPEFRAGRFGVARLHHVRVSFVDAVAGPIAIGDGRYLGLGVMAPVKEARRDVVCFELRPGVAEENRVAALRAVRRALMALARDEHGRIPGLFSGHEDDGRPAASGGHDHIFLALLPGEGSPGYLMVAAPWALGRGRPPRDIEANQFESVVGRLRTVRAGGLGVLELGAPGDLPPAWAGPARVWRSQTPYCATRQARRGQDAAEAATADLAAECRRRGLPTPAATVHRARVGPRGGNLTAEATLRFEVAVRGPMLLGRDSHGGGGLFRPCSGAAGGR